MYQTILVAIDLTPESEPLLSRATQLAAKLGAAIHLIYVEPGLRNHSIEEVELGLEFMHKKAMEQHQQRLDFLCEKTQTKAASIKLVTGHIADQIVLQSEAIHADLVIMGEHHSFWHLQHTNRQVMKEASCDCLIIRAC